MEKYVKSAALFSQFSSLLIYIASLCDSIANLRCRFLNGGLLSGWQLIWRTISGPVLPFPTMTSLWHSYHANFDIQSLFFEEFILIQNSAITTNNVNQRPLLEYSYIAGQTLRFINAALTFS